MFFADTGKIMMFVGFIPCANEFEKNAYLRKNFE
jgi:hypothetical protein